MRSGCLPARDHSCCSRRCTQRHQIRLAASSGAARVLPSPACTAWAQPGHDQKIIVEACTQPAAPARTPPNRLTWQMVGPEGARVLGESDYVVLPPWRRKEPIVDVLTKHEGAPTSPPDCWTRQQPAALLSGIGCTAAVCASCCGCSPASPNAARCSPLVPSCSGLWVLLHVQHSERGHVTVDGAACMPPLHMERACFQLLHNGRANATQANRPCCRIHRCSHAPHSFCLPPWHRLWTVRRTVQFRWRRSCSCSAAH